MARNEAAPLTPATPGFYLRPRPRGFAVHLNATPQHLRDVRALTAKVLTAAGIDADTVESAQLVVSELVGNAVRAFGDWVPLVVEVRAVPFGVSVNVHDPDPRRLPRRRGVALDDAEAESGRGLSILDLLAPGWRVAHSPIGKQVRCRLARADCEAARA
ncbi:ATP-binding protein [Streptomyces sp. NPDC057654]|uniref:ATP-binding protein n=1 Tax=Streptomyces sp. NPDC057654 TaxID=3346196 RepID=UPI00367C9ECB